MSEQVPAGGFEPPMYPYDRLGELSREAQRLPGGMVDLSVGTPCDAPPAAVLEALRSSGTERGYPSSVGSVSLRAAAAGWMKRRCATEVEPDAIAACVGTKEFVSSTPWFLRLRDPSRDTVLHPAIAYPTYAFGARIAGCRSVGVPQAPGGGIDLEAITEADAARALCLWVNSPSNPTGSLSDLDAAAEWGRARGVVVLSDECYAELTWAGPPRSILCSGAPGVLAVHSLSKRSNMAGLRFGFYAGDASLVSYLSELRKHAGLMVPGPVQDAAAAALADDVHASEQRNRYEARLERLLVALEASGIEAAMPEGSFYLWLAAPSSSRRSDSAAGSGSGSGSGWHFAQTLARRAGVLVSPGDFYGEMGVDHVRLAAVALDDRIDLVVRRLAELDLL